MRRNVVYLSLVALISSSIFFGPPAVALTNSDCTQTSSGLTLTALASGSSCLITITAGTGSWTIPAGAIDVDVLIVGGGGGGAGGGSRAGNACNTTSSGTRAGGGGGGGGGGQVRETKFYANAGQAISITIGAGGAGGAGGGCRLAGLPGANGETTTIGTLSSMGGGGGLGGTNLGEGGAGGFSYDSSGNLLPGGTIINAGDCPGNSAYGCIAAGGGASTLGAGSSPISNGTATSGANGSEGLSANIYPGVFGSGGGGGNRHPSSPPAATRAGGSGGTNAGDGNNAGNGTAAIANFGGGGGGGRGNGADAANSGSNAGNGGAGGSGLIVLKYVPTFSIAVPQPTISGQIFKGVNTTIAVTIPVTGVVRFYVNNKRISTCKDRITSGSAPNNVATCTWKPSVQGQSVITVGLIPTNNSYSFGSSTPLTVRVLQRTTRR